ncbi:hypothetical protein ACK3TF_005814 [Chlorella vulgaris]
MQERSSVKVLQYAADAAAAAASAAAQDRQMATPSGRRHSAYHRHLEVGSIARSAAVARKALMSGSGGVRGCLVWHTERQEGEEEEEAAREADVAAGGSRLVQLKRKFGQQKAELRGALAAGLRVVGVGVGGNPLSLQRSTYLAVRPGMKWY